MKKVMSLLFCIILCFQYGFSQGLTSINLSDFDAFESPSKNWIIASDISMGLTPSSLKIVNGTGVLVNKPMKRMNKLVSKKQLEGDVELNFDFMASRNSNAAIYLFGRYKIILSDSWAKLQPSSRVLGTLERSRVATNSSFNFISPNSNLSKAPGLWQHLKIKFRAPTFDLSGNKIANASFEEVYLNNVLIHQGIEISGPSLGSAFNDEKAMGPLVFQGDENHAIAFRNIAYKPLTPAKKAEIPKNHWAAIEFFRPTNPIFLTVKNTPYLLRSYLNVGAKKRTHAISVGNPNHTNYSYDLKQGALLLVWRGPFADVTGMWESRGEPQLAIPLGAVTTLSTAPSFAFLNDPGSAWPDSIPFDEFDNQGYSLDSGRNPTFHYRYGGVSVDDKITMVENGEALKREIKVTNAPHNLFFRLASGTSVESLGKGLYLIGDKAYYIRVDVRLKPTVRKAHGMEELVVAFDNLSSLDYSIIF